MDGTFHPFSDLPWEIRDMIWNLALRPAVPGVHVFKLYNPKTDDGVDKNIDVFVNYDGQRLAAPLSKKSPTDITRNRNNPSTYLIDGGLWTACKESRLVMERNFHYRKWRSLLKENPETVHSLSIKERMDMPETGYFARHNGGAYFFTVFPHQDLFILRPQNLETINWSSFDDIETGSYGHGFAGLRNIALEFNPKWKWEDSIVRNIVNMAIDAGSELPGLKIWIVDYSLRRSHSAAVGRQSTYPFQEGVAFHLKGRRLVPVDPFQSGDWTEIEKVNGKYAERVTDRAGMISIQLVDYVCEEIWRQCDRFEELSGLAVSVGLLAWDST